MSKKTQRERRQRQFRSKIVIIVGAVLAVIIVVAAVLIMYLRPTFTAEPEAAPDAKAAASESVARTEKDGKLRDTAAEEVKKGDVDKAGELYTQAIASENSTVRKVQLYVDQSGVLYTAGRYTEAFEAAKRAEQLSDDKFIIADWLSRIYEDQKEYAKAATYYRLAGEWAGSPQNITGIDKVMFDKEAERVEKLIGSEAAR